MREVITAPSNTVWGILRVAVTDNTDADLRAARAFFDGVTAMPLGSWAEGVAEPPAVKGDYRSTRGCRS